MAHTASAVASIAVQQQTKCLLLKFVQLILATKQRIHAETMTPKMECLY